MCDNEAASSVKLAARHIGQQLDAMFRTDGVIPIVMLDALHRLDRCLQALDGGDQDVASKKLDAGMSWQDLLPATANSD